MPSLDALGKLNQFQVGLHTKASMTIDELTKKKTQFDNILKDISAQLQGSSGEERKKLKSAIYEIEKDFLTYVVLMLRELEKQRDLANQSELADETTTLYNDIVSTFDNTRQNILREDSLDTTEDIEKFIHAGDLQKDIQQLRQEFFLRVYKNVFSRYIADLADPQTDLDDIKNIIDMLDAFDIELDKIEKLPKITIPEQLKKDLNKLKEDLYDKITEKFFPSDDKIKSELSQAGLRIYEFYRMNPQYQIDTTQNYEIGQNDASRISYLLKKDVFFYHAPMNINAKVTPVLARKLILEGEKVEAKLLELLPDEGMKQREAAAERQQREAADRQRREAENRQREVAERQRREAENRQREAADRQRREAERQRREFPKPKESKQQEQRFPYTITKELEEFLLSKTQYPDFYKNNYIEPLKMGRSKDVENGCINFKENMISAHDAKIISFITQKDVIYYDVNCVQPSKQSRETVQNAEIYLKNNKLIVLERPTTVPNNEARLNGDVRANSLKSAHEMLGGNTIKIEERMSYHEAALKATEFFEKNTDLQYVQFKPTDGSNANYVLMDKKFAQFVLANPEKYPDKKSTKMDK